MFELDECNPRYLRGIFSCLSSGLLNGRNLKTPRGRPSFCINGLQR